MTETPEDQPRPATQPVRRDNARVGAITGTVLALVTGAAITFAASPAASPSQRTAPAAADASASPQVTAAPEGSTGPGASSDPGAAGPKDKDKPRDRAGRAERRGPGFGHRGGPGFGGGLRIGPGHGIGIRGLHAGTIEVTAIDGAALSLATENGWTRTITIGGDTKLTRDDETITLADIAVGDRVALRERRADDGTFTVIEVMVLRPMVAGEVTARTASTITVKALDGTTVTVNVDADTKYHVRRAQDGSLTDVEVGAFIVARGTRAADGSLDASDIATRKGFGPRGDRPHDGTTDAPAEQD